GRPPSASTHRPESSAIAGSPVSRLARRALASAFSMNVECGSLASVTPSAACASTVTPSGASSCVISASLPALPDARTMRSSFIASSPSLPERRPLQLDEAADADGGQLEQCVHLHTRERRAL